MNWTNNREKIYIFIFYKKSFHVLIRIVLSLCHLKIPLWPLCFLKPYDRELLLARDFYLKPDQLPLLNLDFQLLLQVPCKISIPRNLYSYSGQLIPF